MHFNKIIKTLKKHRANLSQELIRTTRAIDALIGRESKLKHVTGIARVQRHMSAAARKKISIAQKRRFALLRKA